jgi:acyl-homoserine lactone synthase
MLAALRIEITPETPALLAAGHITASALRIDQRVAA